MNAEIEHASPYGKDAGEKVPGQKRKIGPARCARGSRVSAGAASHPAPRKSETSSTIRPTAADRTAPGRTHHLLRRTISDRIATPHLATVNRPRINRRRLLRLCDRRGCGDGANAADAAVAQTQADLTSHSGRPAWRIDYCCCCCCCCWSSDCNAGGGGGGAVHVSTGENFVDAGGRSSRDT